MNRVRIFSLVVLLCLSLSARSQDVKQIAETTSIMQENNIPGLSLGIVSEGEVRMQSGLGLKNTIDQVDNETVFSAASLSKPVFAYIVMQLVEEGILDLHTPLYEYFDYPDVAADKRHTEVTAKMILSHTSGLPNWRKKKLKFKYSPGERYSYSGEGFVWLQRVVEYLTQKDLETLAQEYVFQPLDMNRSSYLFLNRFEDNFSISFKENGESREKYKKLNANAAASLQTTGGDYAKFIVALLGGDAISAASRDLMFTPVKPTQPKEDKPLVFWGLGVGIQLTENGPQIFQWGDNWTFKGYFTANVNSKDAIVYLTNSESGLKPLKEIVATYIDDPQPAADWLDY